MNSQFKRGVIELCVLKLLTKERLSTYGVLDRLSKPLDVNENTVYPVIRRLLAEGYLDVEKKENPVGAPRKYFFASASGVEYVSKLQKEWNLFTTAVDSIIGGQDE
jgi:PadR family transcriptional regulator, regulatory protein PadR